MNIVTNVPIRNEYLPNQYSHMWILQTDGTICNKQMNVNDVLHSAWMANKFCIGLLHSCSTGIIGVQITELQITELQIKQPNLVSWTFLEYNLAELGIFCFHNTGIKHYMYM